MSFRSSSANSISSANGMMNSQTQLLHFALFRRRKGAGMLGFSRALSLCGAK
jgi:hypothetical protein